MAVAMTLPGVIPTSIFMPVAHIAGFSPGPKPVPVVVPYVGLAGSYDENRAGMSPAEHLSRRSKKRRGTGIGNQKTPLEGQLGLNRGSDEWLPPSCLELVTELNADRRPTESDPQVRAQEKEVRDPPAGSYMAPEGSRPYGLVPIEKSVNCLPTHPHDGEGRASTKRGRDKQGPAEVNIETGEKDANLCLVPKLIEGRTGYDRDRNDDAGAEGVGEAASSGQPQIRCGSNSAGLDH